MKHSNTNSYWNLYKVDPFILKSKLDLKAALTQYLSFLIDFFPVILFIYSSVGGE